MFKILIALSLFVAIQGQLVGGFTDRPDLIGSPVTRNMVKLAVNELANGENLRVSPVNIVSVATQVVNGINYRIVFTARPFASNTLVSCTTRIYQQFSGEQSVSSVNCA
jgi:predicted PilT family ATPase